MPSQRVLTALEDWRSEFEDDRIIKARDRVTGHTDTRYVKRSFRKIADQLGLEAISFGSCRMVFALSPHRVLKVGYSRFGMRSNLLEAEASRDLPRRLRATVYDVASDGLWLVQERASKQRINMRYSEARQLRLALERAFDDYVNDFHSGNIGRRRDGSLILLDLEFLNRRVRPYDSAELRRYLNYA